MKVHAVHIRFSYPFTPSGGMVYEELVLADGFDEETAVYHQIVEMPGDQTQNCTNLREAVERAKRFGKEKLAELNREAEPKDDLKIRREFEKRFEPHPQMAMIMRCRSCKQIPPGWMGKEQKALWYAQHNHDYEAQALARAKLLPSEPKRAINIAPMIHRENFSAKVALLIDERSIALDPQEARAIGLMLFTASEQAENESELIHFLLEKRDYTREQMSEFLAALQEFKRSRKEG